LGNFDGSIKILELKDEKCIKYLNSHKYMNSLIKFCEYFSSGLSANNENNFMNNNGNNMNCVNQTELKDKRNRNGENEKNEKNIKILDFI